MNELYNPLVYPEAVQNSGSGIPGSLMGAGLQKSIADIVGNPDDIPKEIQKQNFPFFNRILQLSNLSMTQALNILDDQELAYIETLNGKRRYDIRRNYSRADYVRSRAYAEAAISLSIGGFAVRKLTEVHKHITYSDSSRTGGGLFGWSPKGGNE